MGLSLNINKKRGIGVALVSFVALALGVQSFATINQSQALASSAPELTRVEPVLWDGSNYKGINVDVSYKNISGLQSITVSTLRAGGTVVTKTAKQKLIEGTNTALDGTFTAPIVFQELTYSEASSDSWNVPSTTVWTKNTAPIKVTVKLETSNGVAELTSDVITAGKDYLTLIPSDIKPPVITVSGIVSGQYNPTKVNVSIADETSLGGFYVDLYKNKVNTAGADVIDWDTKKDGGLCSLYKAGEDVLSRDCTIPQLDDGIYWVAIGGKDDAGNTPVRQDIKFIVDKTKPTIAFVQPTNVVNLGSITAQATDNVALKNIAINVYADKDGKIDETKIVNGVCNVKVSGADQATDCAMPTYLPDGNYWLKANAGDMAGNISVDAPAYLRFTVNKFTGSFGTCESFSINASNMIGYKLYAKWYVGDTINGTWGSKGTIDRADYTWWSGNGKFVTKVVYNVYTPDGQLFVTEEFTNDKQCTYRDLGYWNANGTAFGINKMSGFPDNYKVIIRWNNGSAQYTTKTMKSVQEYGWWSGSMPANTIPSFSYEIQNSWGGSVYKSGTINNPSYNPIVVGPDTPISTPPAPVIIEPTNPAAPAEPTEGGQRQTDGATTPAETTNRTPAPIDAASLVRRQQVALAAPVYNGAVLGVNTETDATDDEAAPVVVAQNNTIDRNDASKTGEVLAAQDEKAGGPWKLLADVWYLWVLALAGLAWWIIAAVRRKREDDQYFAS